VSSVRLLWRLTAMNVMTTIEYRGAFLVYMLNNVLGPLISLLVWLTVSEQGVALPYTRSQFVTYYVLLSVAAMLTSTWIGAFLVEDIRLGNLTPWLLRPAPGILSYIGNNLGEKAVKLPLLLPLVAIVAVVFRHDLRPPTDLAAWGLFLLCLPAAAATAFFLDVTVALLAFWLDDVRGLLRLQVLVGAFLSGRFVPLELFPPELASFSLVQPFRYTLSFPLEVLTDALSQRELWLGLAAQLGYPALLYGLYRLLWSRGLRRYSATGA